MEEIWLERIDSEYKEFKKNMLDRDKESIFLNCEIIMVYNTIHSYLIATKDDIYRNLTLMEIYEYYAEDDDSKFCLTTDDGIIQLLDYVLEEHDRNVFYDKYEEEFQRFKNMFIGAHSETIFNDYERIRFYNLIFNFIQNEEYYYVENYTRRRTIDELWQKYNDYKEKPNLNNRQLIIAFLSETD